MSSVSAPNTESTPIPGPIRPIVQPAHIPTPRLILSALKQSDLTDCHRLRSDPKAMYFTVTGRVDPDEAATQDWLDKLIGSTSSPRGDVFSFAVRIKPVLKQNGEEMVGQEEEKSGGTFIGQVSVRPPYDGRKWPALGYVIEPLYWGKGYGSEAVAACVKAWWGLPRREMQEKAEEEILEAWTEVRNEGSKVILARCGFEMVREYYEGEDWRGPATLQDWHMRRPTT